MNRQYGYRNFGAGAIFGWLVQVLASPPPLNKDPILRKLSPYIGASIIIGGLLFFQHYSFWKISLPVHRNSVLDRNITVYRRPADQDVLVVESTTGENELYLWYRGGKDDGHAQHLCQVSTGLVRLLNGELYFTLYLDPSLLEDMSDTDITAIGFRQIGNGFSFRDQKGDTITVD